MDLRWIDGRLTDESYDRWLARTVAMVTDRLKQSGPSLEADDRDDLRDSLVQSLQEQAADTPRNRMAVVVGGRPGAGKSLVPQLLGLTNYFELGSDRVKVEMIQRGWAWPIPDLTPLECAPLIHHECASIADTALVALTSQGTNLLIDGTLSNPSDALRRVSCLVQSGYDVIGVFMQVSATVSMQRTLDRHRRGVEAYLNAGEGLGGRFVNPTICRRPASNRRVFEDLCQRGLFSRWEVYANDGLSPALLRSGRVVRATA